MSNGPNSNASSPDWGYSGDSDAYETDLNDGMHPKSPTPMSRSRGRALEDQVSGTSDSAPAYLGQQQQQMRVRPRNNLIETRVPLTDEKNEPSLQAPTNDQRVLGAPIFRQAPERQPIATEQEAVAASYNLMTSSSFLSGSNAAGKVSGPLRVGTVRNGSNVHGGPTSGFSLVPSSLPSVSSSSGLAMSNHSAIQLVPSARISERQATNTSRDVHTYPQVPQSSAVRQSHLNNSSTFHPSASAPERQLNVLRAEGHTSTSLRSVDQPPSLMRDRQRDVHGVTGQMERASTSTMPTTAGHLTSSTRDRHVEFATEETSEPPVPTVSPALTTDSRADTSIGSGPKTGRYISTSEIAAFVQLGTFTDNIAQLYMSQNNSPWQQAVRGAVLLTGTVESWGSSDSKAVTLPECPSDWVLFWTKPRAIVMSLLLGLKRSHPRGEATDALSVSDRMTGEMWTAWLHDVLWVLHELLHHVENHGASLLKTLGEVMQPQVSEVSRIPVTMLETPRLSAPAPPSPSHPPGMILQEAAEIKQGSSREGHVGTGNGSERVVRLEQRQDNSHKCVESRLDSNHAPRAEPPLRASKTSNKRALDHAESEVEHKRVKGEIMNTLTVKARACGRRGRHLAPRYKDQRYMTQPTASGMPLQRRALQTTQGPEIAGYYTDKPKAIVLERLRRRRLCTTGYDKVELYMSRRKGRVSAIPPSTRPEHRVNPDPILTSIGQEGQPQASVSSASTSGQTTQPSLPQAVVLWSASDTAQTAQTGVHHTTSTSASMRLAKEGGTGTSAARSSTVSPAPRDVLRHRTSSPASRDVPSRCAVTPAPRDAEAVVVPRVSPDTEVATAIGSEPTDNGPIPPHGLDDFTADTVAGYLGMDFSEFLNSQSWLQNPLGSAAANSGSQSSDTAGQGFNRPSQQHVSSAALTPPETVFHNLLLPPGMQNDAITHNTGYDDTAFECRRRQVSQAGSISLRA
ncbi:hypothetical protein L226DRAFT_520095 [Lentinus tigrinus ALCF2SS1-7]|uniref:uncharacterized protein n=1 Tax=Lentinus tigrinus ALCF2SS1-7 TaxID=1328758 RepID=UPI0011663CF8|nr:hypothetical protein L226DRAFT_520095 [Lentinus tigrinus ALCF2SS1-7]